MYRAETPYGVVTLPPLQLIDLEIIRVTRAAPEKERFWTLVEALATDDVLDVIDLIPNAEMKKLYFQWEAHCGISFGELARISKILDDTDHRESLEADLIDKGLRLRHCPAADFDWHDLKVIIRHLPVTSNLFRALYPDRAGWTLEAFLLADQADALHWLQWSKTKDAAKGRNRPKRIPRPGIKQEQDRAGSKPKAAPLSVIKKRMTQVHAALTAPDRAQKINDLFS